MNNKGRKKGEIKNSFPKILFPYVRNVLILSHIDTCILKFSGISLDTIITESKSQM